MLELGVLETLTAEVATRAAELLARNVGPMQSMRSLWLLRSAAIVIATVDASELRELAKLL